MLAPRATSAALPRTPSALGADAEAALLILRGAVLAVPQRPECPAEEHYYWRAGRASPPLRPAAPAPAPAPPAPAAACDPLLHGPNPPPSAESLAVPPPPEIMASGASSLVNGRIRLALLRNLVSPAQRLLGGGQGLLARLAHDPVFCSAAAAVGLSASLLERAGGDGGGGGGGGGNEGCEGDDSAPLSSRSTAAAAELWDEAQLLKGKGARGGAPAVAALDAEALSWQRHVDLLKRLTLAVTQLQLDALGELQQRRYTAPCAAAPCSAASSSSSSSGGGGALAADPRDAAAAAASAAPFGGRPLGDRGR